MRRYVLLTFNNGTTSQSLHYPYFRHESRYTSIDLHIPLTAGQFLGPEAAASLCRLLVTVRRVVGHATADLIQPLAVINNQTDLCWRRR
jgi:hypothetical protein